MTGRARKTVRRSETILVVDDELHLRNVVAEVLGMNGYAVLAAAGPSAALLIGATHRGPIGLLLTDVVMPEMSGFELADRVQAARPGLRVLYMSGYVDRDAIRYRIQEGGAALLMKPFTPEALLRRVRGVFDEPAPGVTQPTDLPHSRRYLTLALETPRAREDSARPAGHEHRPENSMDDTGEKRRTVIRQRLADGALPRSRPRMLAPASAGVTPTLTVGVGGGQPCSACGETIGTQEIQLSYRYSTGYVIAVHQGCDEMWREEVNRPRLK